MLSALLLVLPYAACAGVTLQECRDRARENYPLVRKYDLIAATRDCNLRNASLSWLPRLEIGGQYSWLNNVTRGEDLTDLLGQMGSMIDLSDKNERPWQYQVSALVTQNVWDGGASSLGRKTAEAAAARDKAEVDVSIYSLERQVDEVFFSILLLEERRRQTEGLISVLEHDLERMRDRFDEGSVSSMDLKTMEVEVKSASQQMDKLDANLVSSRLSLSLLTGADMSAEELITPAEPSAFLRRPDYALVESNRRLLELNLKKLDVDLSPKVGLFADMYYGYPNHNLFRNLSSPDPGFNARIGVQLKFNLYPLYTRKNDKALINQQLRQLDIQADILDFNARLGNAGASQEVRFLRRTLDGDAEILDLRRDIRRAAEQKLEDGVIDAADLLLRINEESDAALQESIHRIELLRALYRQEEVEE